MKITSNLTHVATEIEFEAPLNEEELLAVFEKSGVQGFPAELDIAERTEDHVQMMSLDGLLGFAKAWPGLGSVVTYDVTYFPARRRRGGGLTSSGSWRATWRSAPRSSATCARPRSRSTWPSTKRDASLPVQHRGGLHGRHRVRAWARHERLPAPQALHPAQAGAGRSEGQAQLHHARQQGPGGYARRVLIVFCG